MLPDPERKAAKCADGQAEADEIAEPPPHLQHRQGDAADDRLKPRDDGRHGGSPGKATIALTLSYQDAKDAALRRGVTQNTETVLSRHA